MEELLKELDEIKQKMAEIEKKIEEKKMETGRWKPEKGDIYWFIIDNGWIRHCQWNNKDIDKERYAIGNCYQTKEECKFVVEKLKVIAELKEYEESKNRVWDGINHHYYFYYDYITKEIDITQNFSCKFANIYFESKEKVRQAIASIGENRIKKYYLEVEE